MYFNFTHTKWPSLKNKNKKPKWRSGFLTNCDKKELPKRLPLYELAAAKFGTTIRIESDAYDIGGNLVRFLSAIYINDATKVAEFREELARLRKDPVITNKVCNCSITILMKSGCQCGGN